MEASQSPIQELLGLREIELREAIEQYQQIIARTQAQLSSAIQDLVKLQGGLDELLLIQKRITDQEIS